MTRGRDSNIAYVALDKPDDSHAAPHPDDVNAQSILFGVLRHPGSELSAHQTIRAEHKRWSSIAQLAAEYETIAGLAQHDRWATLIRASGLDPEQAEAVIASDAFGPLTAELRRAEAHQHNVQGLLPRLVARRSLEDADDPAAVLVHRVRLAARSPGNRRLAPCLIAGLIPEVLGPVSDEMRLALDERRDLIDSRARSLAEDAVQNSAPWMRRLGQPPANPREREAWLRQVSVVAAYRDRYRIESRAALGSGAANNAQHNDEELAEAALRRAAEIAARAADGVGGRPAGIDEPAIRA